jgi:hypothetical protein
MAETVHHILLALEKRTSSGLRRLLNCTTKKSLADSPGEGVFALALLRWIAQ